MARTAGLVQRLLPRVHPLTYESFTKMTMLLYLVISYRYLQPGSMHRNKSAWYSSLGPDLYPNGRRRAFSTIPASLWGQNKLDNPETRSERVHYW